MSLKRQFTFGVFAQGYSQAVNIGSQLLVLPFLISIWGAERYGAWLIISALPSYISMADLGFAQISANDMTMRMARGDRDGAVVVNQTAWLFNSIVNVVLLIATAAFVLTVPIETAFNIHAASGDHIAASTFLLGILTLSSLAFGVIGAGMRSVGLLWLVVTANSTARLTEVFLLIGCTYFGGGFLLVASVMLLNRFLVLGPISFWFYRRHPHLRPSIRRADIKLMRKMVVPSVAYMSYTLSYALNIQGVSLLVGMFLGPVAVVTVNAVRTFTRLGRAAASMVISSIEPIFAQLAGSDANNHGKKAFRYLIAASVLGSAIYAAGVILFGEHFLQWWTRGTVVHQDSLINLMLLAVVFEIGWYTLQTPFVSTNRHSVFALWLLVLSVGSLFFLWLTIKPWGIDAAGLIAAGLNFGMLIITIAISVQKRGQLIDGR
jgi:O-antigen/teichoic acid export membrane protein